MRYRISAWLEKLRRMIYDNGRLKFTREEKTLICICLSMLDSDEDRKGFEELFYHGKMI